MKRIAAISFATLSLLLSSAGARADTAQRLEISLNDVDATPLPPLPAMPPDPAQLSTPEQIAANQQKLEAQLAAEGKAGMVEVKVETDANGKKQVKVEVRATQAQ